MPILAALLLAAQTAVQAAPPTPMSDAAFAAAFGDLRASVSRQTQEIEDDHAGLEAKCAKVVKNLDAVSDQGELAACADFYWHNGTLDSPPCSYNNVIKIDRRLLQLDPTNAEVRGGAAWLLWSKWVTWTLRPQDMPDGEGKKEESLKLFENGLAYNQSNPAFYEEYANHLYAFIKDFAKAAEIYQHENEVAATDTDSAVRARLGAARSYRKLGNMADASKWYKAVLAIDPQNSIALKALKDLNQPRGKPRGILCSLRPDL